MNTNIKKYYLIQNDECCNHKTSFVFTDLNKAKKYKTDLGNNDFFLYTDPLSLREVLKSARTQRERTAIKNQL